MTIWKNPAVLRLWLADILSKAGSQITRVALPLTAVLVLEATPAQMGILGVARSLPNLLFGLFVGVWVDRVKRGPVLVAADVGRALLLLSIPAAAWLGILTFTQITAVVFATATLTIFFTLGALSILPTLVQGEQLVEANSKFALSDSILSIVGPGIAGGLIQLITAPIAILVDAVSYLVSAFTLRTMGSFEQAVSRPARQSTVWREIGEGIHELLRTPILRALTLSVVVGSFGGAIQNTVYFLFVANTLQISPTTIGIIFAFGGAGSLMGAVVAERLGKLIGVGWSIVLGNALWAAGTLLVPLATGGVSAIMLLCAGQLVSAIGATVWSIHQMSLRQTITPANLFARATAARRFLLFGMTTAGAALGGWLGTVVGLRMTLVVGAVIFSLGAVVVLLSPVRATRVLAQQTED